MVNLKQATVTLDNCVFSETEWIRLVENTAVSSNLDETEKERIKKSPVAKLLAALPYYAGCSNADQLAVFKVVMYLAAARNPGIFMHREGQSVRERILPATICPGGDSSVVELVTTFLELISINDHLADFEDDMRTGHPNPLGANILFYYARKEYLTREIAVYPDKELVYRLTGIADPARLYFWGV